MPPFREGRDFENQIMILRIKIVNFYFKSFELIYFYFTKFGDSKIATCENFQMWKTLLYRRGVLVGNSDADGRAIYNKYCPLTTNVW